MTSAILAVMPLLLIVGICVSYLLLAFGFWGSERARGLREL